MENWSKKNNNNNLS